MVLLSLQVCLFCHLLTFLFISILFCIFSSVASQICLGIFARLNKMRNVFLLFAYVRYMVYEGIQVLCFEWPLSTWSSSTLQTFLLNWDFSWSGIINLRNVKKLNWNTLMKNHIIYWSMQYKVGLKWIINQFLYVH